VIAARAPLERRVRSARTVGGWIDAIAERFAAAGLVYGHGTHTASDEAAWLVAHALRLSFDALSRFGARAVGAADARAIGRLAARRIRTREPLAYLLHEAWLGEHRFYVDRRVLVPRSFIAEHLRMRRLPWPQRASHVRRVLDLCTGSACLAIVAAHRFASARVDAADLSRDALAVARRNVREHGLVDRVRVIESNVFAALAGERYDLILSNPPYVDDRAMRALPAEYRHEPRLGLAGGADGLALVRRIVAQAHDHLTPHGWLVLEIGHNRRAMTRTFGQLPLRWLDTSAGSDYVCAIPAAALTSWPPRAR
jgi:ribosomal protein L3 glutamine methyltransferase